MAQAHGADHHRQRPTTRRRIAGALTAVLVLAAIVPLAALGGAAGADATRDFGDVPPSHPFRTEIDWMVEEGITGGYPDGTYRPSATITRQSLAAFLHRLAGEPAPTGTSSFSDVPASHPFRTEIDWMVGAGITTGYPDGTFRPTATVTRQSAAAFLARFAGEPAPAGSSSFPDVPASHPFRDEIDWMVGAGITEGYPDGTFRPAVSLTRQSGAAFLYRLAANPSAWDDDAQPLGVTPPDPGDAVDCTDFTTWAEAQAWFDWFSALGDPAGLDPDLDGVACEELPGAPDPGAADPAFNAGNPASLDSWLFDTHQVLRLADGSSLVSRRSPSDVSTITKLAPDGTVDTGWGDGGDAPVEFQASAFGSGFDEGVEQTDGSVVLYGQTGFYTFGTTRLTPEGDLDTTYGDAGKVEFNVFFGDAPDRCSLTPEGGLVCATTGLTAIVLETWDADGDATGTQNVPIDISAFKAPAPSDVAAAVATSTQSAFTGAVERTGDTTIVVVSTSTAFYDDDGFSLAFSENEDVIVRVTPTGLDTTFGVSGYRNVDLEPTDLGLAGTGTDWGQGTLTLDLAPTTGAITLLETVRDSAGTNVNPPTGASASAIVRLTPGGQLDPAWGGDGVVAVQSAGGAPVFATALATRDGSQVTVIGTFGSPVVTPVVLRYDADGTLDEDFSADGQAVVPGAQSLSGLDLRNGRTTVGGRSGPTSEVEPAADALVTVLFG